MAAPEAPLVGPSSFLTHYTSSPSSSSPSTTVLAPSPAGIIVTYPSSEHTIPNSHVTPLARTDFSSTGRGILIGMLSAFGSAAFVAIALSVVYFFRCTRSGRIFLDRLGRPGEYDDEQAFAKDEAQALEEMDDLQRAEYMRAKAFIQANPPESVQTDISLSQFLAIQEKGVSAWEFEPELEIANCFVEARTEIEFFDTECSVQTNLPVPKQNEVYYWEAKIYDMSDSSTISIGMATKPYPLFRLPGYHKHSVAYFSSGCRRHNQPFPSSPTLPPPPPSSNSPTATPSTHNTPQPPLTSPSHPSPHTPPYTRGDVIGCGYRPRTGTVFFTRNGRRLEPDFCLNQKSQNFFPTIGCVGGPAAIHVNFGAAGFVFIEANVKKWGLAPMIGSLAPPPPYGSEEGSILVEEGRGGVREGMGWHYAQQFASQSLGSSHTYTQQHYLSASASGRGRSSSMRASRQMPTSPGPERSPTDISLAQLSLIESTEDLMRDDGDAGEGPSAMPVVHPGNPVHGLGVDVYTYQSNAVPPPEYASPLPSETGRSDDDDTASNGSGSQDGEQRQLLDVHRGREMRGQRSPPIPTYDAAVGSSSSEVNRTANSSS